MTNMLEKVWNESWNDDKYSDLEECITENILTYEEMGRLFTQLVSYHGGKYDEKAMGLLVDMMGEYIDENI